MIKPKNGLDADLGWDAVHARAILNCTVVFLQYLLIRSKIFNLNNQKLDREKHKSNSISMV